MHWERWPEARDAATLAAACARSGTHIAWLDADGTSAEGRWSYLGMHPDRVVRASLRESTHPFDRLEGIDREEPWRKPSDDETPFDRSPRWIGYVGYDAAFHAEERIRAQKPRDDVPVLWLARYPAVVAWDHATGEAFFVGDDRASVERMRATLRATTADVEAPSTASETPDGDDPRLHLAAIERAKRLIADGEIYQVNLARRWEVAGVHAPLALFGAMRRASPVPLGLYLDAGDHVVLGRSMERFLDWDRSHRTIATRPIKGTIARRGDDANEAAALRADPKERAEHTMIVDLMRNDLGRIAELGTVEVERFLEVEPFAGLQHLVSTVRATTRPDVGLRAVLQATFPPGSVTGAPKHRAVQVIEALEPHPRGIYTGAYGFLDRNGGLSLAVAIRTAVVRDGVARYFAGGGIVEASDPAREVAETDLKARVFLDAVGARRG